MGVGHEAVKLWSGILRAADSLVHVLREHDPAAALGVFPKLAGLPGHVLAVVCSAHSGVDGDSRRNHAPLPFLQREERLGISWPTSGIPPRRASPFHSSTIFRIRHPATFCS